MNGEDPGIVISQVSDIVGHIHLSEPDLHALGSGSTPHASIASELARHALPQFATIEMKPVSSETALNVEAIDRAVRFAISHYT